MTAFRESSIKLEQKYRVNMRERPLASVMRLPTKGLTDGGISFECIHNDLQVHVFIAKQAIGAP
jgi:hypothetical protein